MACSYFFMAVMSIPSMYIFYHGNSEQQSDLGIYGVITQLSLGNLGASNTACGSGTSEPPNRNVRINLNCPYGNLYEIQSFVQQTKRNLVNCEAIADAEESKKLGDPNPELSPFPESCTFDQFPSEIVEQMNADFIEKCKGKRQCRFKFR